MKEGRKEGRVGLNAADGQWDQFCFGKEKSGSGISRDEGEPAGVRTGVGVVKRTAIPPYARSGTESGTLDRLVPRKKNCAWRPPCEIRYCQGRKGFMSGKLDESIKRVNWDIRIAGL